MSDTRFCATWLLILLPLVSGCVHAQAKTTPDAPLDMPAPPPRDVEPNDAETPQPVSLPAEPARNTPARPRPAPQPREIRPEPPRPESPKPEPPPVEPPKPAEDAAKPPTTLQTTPAEAEGKEEQQIRALLAKATTALTRIDYRRLDAGARTQYDTAKRFVTQAETALRAKNLVFARSVADKAATLAGQLSGK